MLNQNMLLNAKNRVAINWSASYSLDFSKSYGYAYDSIDTVSKPGFTSSYIYVDGRSYSPSLLDGDRIPTNGTTGYVDYGEYWRSGRQAVMSYTASTTRTLSITVSTSQISWYIYFDASYSFSGFKYVTPTKPSSSWYIRYVLKPASSVSSTSKSATYNLYSIYSGSVSLPYNTSNYSGMQKTLSVSTNLFNNTELNNIWLPKQVQYNYYMIYPCTIRPTSTMTYYTGTAADFKKNYNGKSYTSLPSACRTYNTSPKFTMYYS